MEHSKYACLAENSLGRANFEHGDVSESCFQRDRNRIINSMAFRRLEYKTQVFINYIGDHYRTRLTHSLEVAQIARNIARALGLNEDLAETISLAHDLGHPPFGHAGEEGLDEAAKEFGGFNHNVQTIRILMLLEHRYPEHAGLNLSLETLEGIAKHNGPINIHHDKQILHDLSNMLAPLAELGCNLNTYPSLEAQVASLSDDIAYCNHDLDDGIRAGFITIDEMLDISKINVIYKEMERLHPKAKQNQLISETIRKLTKVMADDITQETRKLLDVHKIRDYNDVKHQTIPLVAFSEEMDKFRLHMKEFLMERVYKHYTINRVTNKAKRLVKQLFEALYTNPDCLPPEWQAMCDSSVPLARVVLDYISGMTDRYAVQEYEKVVILNSFQDLIRNTSDK